ncbi:hypothetical protein HOK00_10055 [bacterium]|jgi:hypothetical protein|nr:hypothetical protein [bacterium]
MNIFKKITLTLIFGIIFYSYGFKPFKIENEVGIVLPTYYSFYSFPSILLKNNNNNYRIKINDFNQEDSVLLKSNNSYFIGNILVEGPNHIFVHKQKLFSFNKIASQEQRKIILNEKFTLYSMKNSIKIPKSFNGKTFELKKNHILVISNDLKKLFLIDKNKIEGKVLISKPF